MGHYARAGFERGGVSKSFLNPPRSYFMIPLLPENPHFVRDYFGPKVSEVAIFPLIMGGCPG